MDNNRSTQPESPQIGMGYLVVRTSTAGGAIPLEGSTVKVWGDRDEGQPPSSWGDVLQIMTTDRDGNTPRLPLPAPARAIAYQPGGVPYAFYNIDVAADGFYPQHFTRVPIYDTITSIQNAYLIPLPEGALLDGREPLGNVVEEGVNPAL
ncbi:MAG: hypothetical protein IJW40_08085 [Clostridia bacterium]|nr:hypothetical protein [Clostridia bacterium]